MVTELFAILQEGRSMKRFLFSVLILTGLTYSYPVYPKPTIGAEKAKPFTRFQPFEWIATGLGKAILIHPKKIAKMLGSAYAQEPSPEDVNEYYKALSQTDNPQLTTITTITTDNR